MKNKLSRISILLFCLLCAVPGLAQGAPTQIDSALLNLSARLGHSVGIGNLSNWAWEQTNFADSALGCPSVSGSGGAVLGYRFELTYNELTHDYRVSADSATVVYCGELDSNTPSSAPESQYSNRLCSETASDGPYMRSRIIYGIEAEVAQGFLNLRGQPSAAGQVLLQIPAGLPFEITAGPDCAEGYVWWLVNANGQTGYVAEAGAGTTFVKPKRPVPLPSREELNTSLVTWLQELSRVEGNFLPQHAWSSDSVYLALPGASGSDSIWLYDLRDQQLSPQMLEHDGGISVIAFRPSRTQILFGSEAGSLHLWQFEGGAELGKRELLFLNAHGGAVSAVSFSGDVNRMASAGTVAYTRAQANRDFAAIVWDLPTVAQQAVLSGHQALIRAIAFSPDGGIIVTGADDGALRFWDADSGASLSSLSLNAAVVALDWSSDGSQIAVALARAADSLQIVDGEDWTPVSSYQLPTAGVASLDFSPDSTLLVAGAAEGIISVWDTEAQQLLVTRETDGGVRAVSFSPDGSLIAVNTDKHALVFYGVPLGSG